MANLTRRQVIVGAANATAAMMVLPDPAVAAQASSWKEVISHGITIEYRIIIPPFMRRGAYTDGFGPRRICFPAHIAFYRTDFGDIRRRLEMPRAFVGTATEKQAQQILTRIKGDDRG